MYYLAERLWEATSARGIPQLASIITNGLLLTEDIVDRMMPFGLKGVKITLDGDRDAHNRMRPLRGGQGTFDRIVQNIQAVADPVAVAIGGKLREAPVDQHPAPPHYLQGQGFARKPVQEDLIPGVRGPRP